MTTIFWLSLGLSAARWAWTEFMRWRDKGVIELQAETIKGQAEKIVSLQRLEAESYATKANLLQRLRSVKEAVG